MAEAVHRMSEQQAVITGNQKDNLGGTKADTTTILVYKLAVTVMMVYRGIVRESEVPPVWLFC